MIANAYNRPLMLNQLGSVDKLRKIRGGDVVDRKVTFNDFSESGYSTTASSDEGSVSPHKNILHKSRKMTSDKLLRQKLASSSGSECKRDWNETSERSKLKCGSESFEQFPNDDALDSYCSSLKSASVTPSPTSPMSAFPGDICYGRSDYHSPSYYDPLHLGVDCHSTCKFVDKDKWVNHSQAVTDGSDFYSAKKGILKKSNLTSSNPHLASDGERLQRPTNLLPFNYGSPDKFCSDSAQVSPIWVPAVYAANKTPSPLIPSDGSRKSAFIPVKPRNQRVQSSSDQSDISSNFFTPVKGPGVADYVASSERVADQLGSDKALFDAPVESHYHTLKPKGSKLKKGTKVSSTSMQDLRDIDPSLNCCRQSSHIHQHSLQKPTPAPRSHIPQLSRELATTQISDNYDCESVGTLDSNTSSSSPVPKVESLTNDAVRLDEYLERCSAKELKRLLKEKLQSKDPKCIKALSTLIPHDVAKQEKSHCVRCHKVSECAVAWIWFADLSNNSVSVVAV